MVSRGDGIAQMLYCKIQMKITFVIKNIIISLMNTRWNTNSSTLWSFGINQVVSNQSPLFPFTLPPPHCSAVMCLLPDCENVSLGILYPARESNKLILGICSTSEEKRKRALRQYPDFQVRFLITLEKFLSHCGM